MVLISSFPSLPSIFTFTHLVHTLQTQEPPDLAALPHHGSDLVWKTV